MECRKEEQDERIKVLRNYDTDKTKLLKKIEDLNAALLQEKQKIEDWVNEQITGAHKVSIESMSHKEAKAKGAMALFGEKYGDTVRVVTIEGTPSMELCGGLHVGNTQEIKKFKLIKESGVSSGVRRVEAVSGSALDDYFENEFVECLKKRDKIEFELNQLKLEFIFDINDKQSSEAKLLELEKLIIEAEAKISMYKKELKKQEDETIRATFMNKASDTSENFLFKGQKIQLLAFEDEIAIDKLREIADQARNKSAKEALAFLALSKSGFFVSKTTESAFPIGEFRQALVSEQNFKGGGDENKAQGKVPANLNFTQLKDWLKTKANV